MHKEVDAVTKLYDFLLWLMPKLEKFLRSQKFILGNRIETLMLDILDLLIEAAYSKNKSTMLRAANLKLEQLRYLIRLSKDMQIINLKAYDSMLKFLLICPTSALEKNFNPRHTPCMPPVKIFFRLEFEQII